MRRPRSVLRAALPRVEALVRGTPVDDTTLEVDLSDRPACDRRVLAEVRRVRPGTTASYGDIAKRVGFARVPHAPSAARSGVTRSRSSSRAIGSSPATGRSVATAATGWIDRDRHLSRKEALLRA